MTHPRHPAARREDLVDDLFGRHVADPYRWLEEPGSAETRAWLAAQESLCREVLDGLPGRRWLRARMAELLAPGVTGPPLWRGERRFFMRRLPGQEHAALHVADPEGTERVLLDPAVLDPTGRTVLDTWYPDREGRRIAYQTSTAGDDTSLLYVLDIASGELVDGPVTRCRRSPIAWLPGGEAFYYVRRLPAHRVPPGEERYHRRVWLHRVGTDPDRDDRLVFGDGGPRTAVYTVGVSGDARWLTVTSTVGAAGRNEVWIADLAAHGPEAPVFTPVQTGVDARTSAVAGGDGRLYLLTDHDAPRRRLAVVGLPDLTADGAPSPSAWKDLIPEDPQARLDHFTVLDSPELDRALLLAVRNRHTISEITVHDLETGERLGDIATPGQGWVGEIRGRRHEAWFTYTDPFTPISVFRWDARDGSTSLWASPPGPPPRTRGAAPAPPAAGTMRQITCTSGDGTPVRVTVLAPRDAPDGPRPAILYVYGGFGLSYKPLYRPEVAAWVEAGGVYAVAHVRGGGEEGADWHRAGAGADKQKSVDDLHAAAEHLCREGWTTPSRLVLSGESNGGLLVAAAMTQRPGRYRAVLCAAPVLDMVRYRHSGLGASWTAEYGSAEIPGELDRLLAYSPYHRVTEGADYPAVLLTVSEGDGVVDPLHARKMCAALQHAAGPEPAPDGRGLTLLRVEPGAGHGARATSRALDLSLDQLAFAAWQSGLPLPPHAS
ncbi:peptidase S9 [Streptomyces cyaneogriseus subsp. noncyanogenus]|uniref:prolyl oligopeptidase n=1 Tax=Streptomyces cyaneogriseus subsp. noncyanogenus TaxID=477245 RepID=A0A0C5GKQ9_9ACTN|nr:prolyl oligopeptidase family serine peptidase [Streptomyces cyaneogriseus]AJP05036.1 peptidase S9 [Streptomyces cyaneogriseus subsp. noncyanogenus]